MHIISKFMACFCCSATNWQRQQSRVMLTAPQNRQRFGAPAHPASHNSSAARFNLIDSPQGFATGFIAHN